MGTRSSMHLAEAGGLHGRHALAAEPPKQGTLGQCVQAKHLPLSLPSKDAGSMCAGQCCAAYAMYVPNHKPAQLPATPR